MKLESRLGLAGCAFYHGTRPALASLLLAMLVIGGRLHSHGIRCGGARGRRAEAGAGAHADAPDDPPQAVNGTCEAPIGCGAEVCVVPRDSIFRRTGAPLLH
jgi:hypothetical protein